MCGIIGGFASNLIASERRVIRDLLHVSGLRGIDSTGVIVVNKDSVSGSKVFTAYNKQVMSPADYVERGQFDIITTAPKSAPTHSAIIGHNRAATVGKITRANAHPFNFSKVIGVHNGTITKDIPSEKTYETDSETLYARMNEIGIEEALVELGFPSYQVAYALVFVDKENQRLGMVSNGRRTLALYHTPGVSYFASEENMLRWVLLRSHVRNGDIIRLDEHKQVNCLHYYDLKSGTLQEVTDISAKIRARLPSAAKGGSSSTENTVPFRPGFSGGRFNWGNQSALFPDTRDTELSSALSDWEREVNAHDRSEQERKEAAKKRGASSGKTGEKETEKGGSAKIAGRFLARVPDGRPFIPGVVYIRGEGSRAWGAFRWGKPSETLNDNISDLFEREKPSAVDKFDESLKRRQEYHIKEAVDISSLDPDEPVFKDQDNFLISKRELEDILASGCAMTGWAPDLAQLILGQDDEGYVRFQGSIIRYTGYPQWLSYDSPQEAMEHAANSYSGTKH